MTLKACQKRKWENLTCLQVGYQNIITHNRYLSRMLKINKYYNVISVDELQRQAQECDVQSYRSKRFTSVSDTFCTFHGMMPDVY